MDTIFFLYIAGWGVAILVGAVLLVKALKDRIKNDEDTYYDKKVKK